MTVAQSLKKARDLIADPEAFKRFGSQGAIAHETRTIAEEDDAESALMLSIAGDGDVWLRDFDSSHTHAEVLAAFDEAIRKAGGAA